MNRIEYMRRLAALLQDVPAEERVATMQYYNDYFDDAGEENEEKVIEELGSPEQVAAEMKVGLGRRTEESGEFRETGYANPQFERKEVPVKYQDTERHNSGNQYSGSSYGGGQERRNGASSYGGNQSRGKGEDAYMGGQTGSNYQYNGNSQYSGQHEKQSPVRKPWTSSGLKAILIFLIILIAAPVLIPLAVAFVCCVFAFGIAGFAIFIVLAAVAVVLALSGLVLFIKGMLTMAVNPAAAMAAMGAGMMLGVIGTIATVAAVRLCMIVIPGLFRFMINICKKPFERKKAVI